MEALPASRTDIVAVKRRSLRAVPAPDTTEFEQFIAEWSDEELGELSAEYVPEWESASLDDVLLALGMPVAFPYGDEVPEVADESADVHERTVVSIEAARLSRHLRELPGLEQKVLRLRFGLDEEPCTHTDIARRVGLSRQHIPRVEERAMQMLRERFGVALEAAAPDDEEVADDVPV